MESTPYLVLSLPPMDTQAIIAQLQEQRDRLTAAIDALEQTSKGTGRGLGRGKKTRRQMSAEARRRIGLAMKKRWAERKKAA